MIQGLLSAVLLSFVVADDAEEPFKLPTLKGNAYLADPFANKDVLGSVWKPSSSQKGKLCFLIFCCIHTNSYEIYREVIKGYHNSENSQMGSLKVDT